MVSDKYLSQQLKKNLTRGSKNSPLPSSQSLSKRCRQQAAGPSRRSFSKRVSSSYAARCFFEGFLAEHKKLQTENDIIKARGVR